MLSKIVEKSYHGNIYHYIEKMPSDDIWYTEYSGWSERTLQLIRKVLKIEETSCDYNYENLVLYDDCGNETSNVDYEYDLDDYEFYKLTFETVDLYDEKDGTIEPYEEEYYVFVDKKKKYDSYEFESDISEQAHDIQYDYDIEDNQYYGDCYPDEINEIRNAIIHFSNSGELTVYQYRGYMTDARNVFDNYARGYLDREDGE